MRKLPLIVLFTLALLGLVACGDDSASPANKQAPEAKPTKPEPDRPQTATGGEPTATACGSATDPTSDDAVDIKAQGVSCDTARAVARALTLDGTDAPLGFTCPDAQTYAAERQRCSKGGAVVSWEVRFD